MKQKDAATNYQLLLCATGLVREMMIDGLTMYTSGDCLD